MRYRRLRIQDLLREEISLIIQRDLRDPGVGFVTILDVRVSEDLKIAKVMCTIYGSDEEKKKTLLALKRSRGFVKFLLGQRVKLKYIPDINFVLDDVYEKAMRIEEILKREASVRKD